MEQSICSRPSRVSARVHYLEEQLDRRDKIIEFLKQEVDSNKAKTFYHEKKIENLYTLVDRLKNKGT